eukprot:1105122-Heterocapsa_arctica.AAC.1
MMMGSTIVLSDSIATLMPLSTTITPFAVASLRGWRSSWLMPTSALWISLRPMRWLADAVSIAQALT